MRSDPIVTPNMIFIKKLKFVLKFTKVNFYRFFFFQVLEAKKLSKRYFSRLITSRLEFLKKPYFNSLEEMEKYSENSVSSIYYLLLEISGINSIKQTKKSNNLI